MHNFISMLFKQLWRYIQPLLIIGDLKRPLGYFIVTALSVGIPAFVGAMFGQIELSITACTGALVILYLRPMPLIDLMIALSVISFGFVISFTLGLLTSFNIYISSASLFFTVVMVTFVCRYHAVPAPGSLFFVLIACLARALPFDLTLAASRVGLLVFGTISACVLALCYNMLGNYLSKTRNINIEVKEKINILKILFHSLVIGFFVGGGYLFASLIGLSSAYWVPVSTVAVLQGANFRAVWSRNIHRIFGTAIGLGIAWVIIFFSPSDWIIAFLIVILVFLIEMLITRNYGLAVIFITPLTVIFANTSMQLGYEDNLITVRLFNIILGGSIGLLGGWFIYKVQFIEGVTKHFKN